VRVISVILALIGLLLLAKFVGSLDFRGTNLPGFIWPGDNVQSNAKPINSSLVNVNADMCNLNSKSNPPRVPIYYVEGLSPKSYLMRTGVYSVYVDGVWYERLSYNDKQTISMGGIIYRVTPIVEFKDHIPVLKDTRFVTLRCSYNRSAGIFGCSGKTPYMGFAEIRDVKPSVFAKDGFSKITMNRKHFEEIRDLTLKITKNAKSDYEKVLAIERFLKENYKYDFRYSTEGDPVYRFLFKEKRGICKHFASAFVVMCNSVGIPARLVVGYKAKPVHGNQTVFGDQAHAWAEVKFKEGWVEFDPTPSGGGKIKTVTEITSVDKRIVANENFTVEGYVRYDGGFVENGFVEIYLKRSKEEDGILVGLVEFKNGVFKANLKAPDIVGRYHVVAHFVGSMAYQESWSDPVVEVYEKPRFIVDIPNKSSEELEIRGRIVLKKLPTEISVVVDGEDRGFVVTDENGFFNLTLNLSKGFHRVEVIHRGSDFVLPSKFEKTVEIGDLEVEISNETVKAWKDNVITIRVFFNGKPVESFKVNNVTVHFGGDFTVRPERVGVVPVFVSAYGFERVVYLKSVSETLIDYRFDDSLKIYVHDSVGNPLNGTIYVNGRGYELKNGFVELDIDGDRAEILYPGDGYHLPARVYAVKGISPIVFIIPIGVVGLSLVGFLYYRRMLYRIDVYFKREKPDLPLIWRVGEIVEFYVFCKSDYVVKIDGTVVRDFRVVFKDEGIHRLEVLALNKKGKVKNSKIFDLMIVRDYGEAICHVFGMMEKVLEVETKSLTAREVLSITRCGFNTTSNLEGYVYGRRSYSREDFIKAFEEVKGCLRDLRS